jgi:hypothetical protein
MFNTLQPPLWYSCKQNKKQHYMDVILCSTTLHHICYSCPIQLPDTALPHRFWSAIISRLNENGYKNVCFKSFHNVEQNKNTDG